MAILTESQIIQLMKDEYCNHLLEAMQEADVYDKRGNMILGKDLKVRHKKSQFEYTIDDVLEDPESHNVQIALRFPDEPRFVAAPEEEEVMADTKVQEPAVLGEDELVSVGTGPGDLALPSKQSVPVLPDIEGEEEEVFFIDQEEFEKEYEVK
jgi:hypothetical protein